MCGAIFTRQFIKHLNNVQMCKYENVQMECKKFSIFKLHLHICTFSYLHILMRLFDHFEKFLPDFFLFRPGNKMSASGYYQRFNF